jgi:hypothetical protein
MLTREEWNILDGKGGEEIRRVARLSVRCSALYLGILEVILGSLGLSCFVLSNLRMNGVVSRLLGNGQCYRDYVNQRSAGCRDENREGAECWFQGG